MRISPRKHNNTGSLAHTYANRMCAYLISMCGIRRHIITSKMADCKLQLVTGVILHIAVDEPALMVAANVSQLLLSRITVECTNLINNMATNKVSI